MLKRIPVQSTGGKPARLRCRLGFHRVRFYLYDDVYMPRCSHCRGIALWWIKESP